jgi:glutathione S-transferase
MSDELVFYTNPRSRGRIVRWMLEELGQPYRAEIVGYGPPMKGPEYCAVNPMGKVPALCHRGEVVTETAAICAYLADTFPQAGLAPASGDKLRAPYYRWLFFGAGPVEATVTNKAMGFIVPEGKAGMAGFGSYELTLDTLEKAVDGVEYLVGGRFSAADVYIGGQIGFGLAFGSIPRRPAFEAYASRVSARPAAVRAREIDDALLAEQTPVMQPA